MIALLKFWRILKARLDRFNGLEPYVDDEDDASDIERLNRELSRLGYQQAAFSPPEVEQE